MKRNVSQKNPGHGNLPVLTRLPSSVHYTLVCDIRVPLELAESLSGCGAGGPTNVENRVRSRVLALSGTFG
jgi:hypothetical protein